MEPYQKASERVRKSGETAVNIGKNIGLTALGGGAAKIGTQAASKLIPGIMAFVNKYVPENLAIKGLEKLDPRFGKLIQGAMGDGYTFDDIKNFLGEKIEKSQSPEDDRNIIQQYSDNLHQYIKDMIGQGNTPLQAAVKAKKFLTGNQTNIIKQIEKEHNTNFENLVESIYGGGQEGQPQQGAPQQAEQQTPQGMQTMQLQGQQQQGGGHGAQALQAILQKINQKLGG